MTTRGPQPSKPKIEIVSRNVDELTLHPGHATFATPTDHEIRRLADDMKGRGLQHPVEILPDGVIIAGQRRWLAAKLLGYATIRCRVRHDLAGRDDDADLEHLLSDNFHRQHLDLLNQGRAFAELSKLYKSRPVSRGRERRDTVAEEFGCSGRRMQRLARILTTPRAVQDAYSAGRLSQVVAESVAGLLPAQQQEIAAAIEAGECPKAAIAKFLPKVAAKPSQQKGQQPTQPTPGILMQVVDAVSRLLKAAEGGELVAEPEVDAVQRIIARLQAFCASASKPKNGRT